MSLHEDHEYFDIMQADMNKEKEDKTNIKSLITMKIKEKMTKGKP